jgi:aminopeptidase N
VDIFERSVKMSSYLVAFAVCNFKMVQTHSVKYKILVDVFARPEAIENGDGFYALQEATNLIEFFSDYFQVLYPLKKSSLILIIENIIFY